MKATNSSGILQPIENCYIETPYKKITMRILPDISDQKQANYADESGMGRSSPLKIFSHGETRSISWTIHLFSSTATESDENLDILRVLQSLVYPDENPTSIVSPPPIVRLKCGNMLADEPLCAVLKSYNVKFPTDVAWDSNSLLPIKFDVDLSFDVVYSVSRLPGSNRILKFGG